ncbi:uncharacterized protein LOC111710494 isoform X2 [Eurytemora carolleeae]|uniref:uncharacterized protein LOC111710494 isoform X2 n=1 Tax=Eurytemora carolleeae TaxID=1294199 RepID=UPI000C76A721|nr:uncharacterized protein LOC111710494 isoform X2 [Eurytemora carolleeae]|eukprot:XP_023340366.1 uncharacterized protein LOC111710494 isoform X2 [Eurytemora affinis]
MRRTTNIMILVVGVCYADEYWSEDYDSGKNCKDENLIVEINKNAEPGFCEAELGKLNDTKVFQSCKLKLSRTLAGRCQSTAIDKPGTLLYCENQKWTICCSHDYKCVKDWLSISDNFSTTAATYLKNKDKWLEGEKSKGYETCHALYSSLDPSIC